MGEGPVEGAGGAPAILGEAGKSLESAFDNAIAKAAALRELTVEKQADLNVAKVRPQQ